jgi:hypothetical protein
VWRPDANEKAVKGHVRLKRSGLWVLVGAYTIALPHVISVYTAIVRHSSVGAAGKIPLALIIALGLVYLAAAIFLKKTIRCLVFMIPCAVIVYGVLSLEPNPNKHIHIPEYVVMSWILFRVLSPEYTGKGIFLLIFICSSMLGMVDEIQQGLYPDRYYGLRDMCINSASTVIGVLALMGITQGPSGGWSWTARLKKLKASLGLVFFGAAGAAFMLVYLFRVKASSLFWGTYPPWLLVWNSLFLGLGSWLILFRWTHGRKARAMKKCSDADPREREVTAFLWLFPILSILLVMHALVVFTGLSGYKFG